jgi:hypothetical protein
VRESQQWQKMRQMQLVNFADLRRKCLTSARLYPVVGFSVPPYWVVCVAFLHILVRLGLSGISITHLLKNANP